VYVNLNAAAAAAVLVVHLTWLLFVIFGALLTRDRVWLASLHIAALLWGVTVELGPWPCPLTALEQQFRDAAGMSSYSEPFLVYYLDRIVYPDIPSAVLTVAGVSVCLVNLGIYWKRLRRAVIKST
jgi:hypothetical protein